VEVICTSIWWLNWRLSFLYPGCLARQMSQVPRFLLGHVKSSQRFKISLSNLAQIAATYLLGRWTQWTLTIHFNTNWLQVQVYDPTLTLHTTNAAILMLLWQCGWCLQELNHGAFYASYSTQEGVTRRSRDGVSLATSYIEEQWKRFPNRVEVLKIAWAWSIWLSPYVRRFRRSLAYCYSDPFTRYLSALTTAAFLPHYTW
jgi:hypothetical protein